MASKTTLGVIFGGKSSEHEVSCVSAAAVIEAADREKYDVVCVGITREGIWWIYDGPADMIRSGGWERDTARLRPAVLSPCPAHHGMIVFNKPEKKYEILRLDCVFPAVHGENCEDGRLQGLLEASGVPYVGCRTCSSAITMDKAFTKQILDGKGIAQAKWLSFSLSDHRSRPEEIDALIEKELGFPVFVKPANAGSSKGISKVASREGLDAAVLLAGAIDEKIVAEAAVSGREIEVALLETEDGVKASVCGQIRPDMEFYSYDSKYVSGGSVCEIPADLPDGVAEKVRQTALSVFGYLDCRGLSRADFFVKDDGEVIFNEINTLPGFTSISMYPKLWDYAGLDFSRLVDCLVSFAMKGEIK